MAPSHVDLSVLWVPIMPETSKLGEQMEQVGADATESFGKGSSGIGDKIHESVTKSRDKIKDVFHRTGSDAGKSMSDAFKEETKAVEDAASDAGEKASHKFRDKAKDLGKELVGAIGPDVKRELGARVEDVVGGALKSAFGNDGVGKQISEAIGGAANQGITSWIGDIQKKLGDTKAAADTTRKAFADFGNGDTTGGVSKLVDGISKLGIGVKDLPGPVQDAIGKFDEAKKTAQGFADIFTGLPGKIGEVGKAIEKLSGPLAVALAAAKDIDDEIRRTGNQQLIDSRGQGLDKYNQGIANTLNGIPGVHAHAQGVGPSGVDLSGVEGLGKGGDVLGSSADGYSAFTSGLPVTGPGSIAASGGTSGLNLSTIPVAAQKYANDCIDASARIILSHSGINMTEDQMMGVIAPGGTIDSQAAGMNRLNPAGGFKAMAGSGGSPAAMFAAIKASIDSGTGSVLNVAPGSSLAGRNFSEGHFIAATGYNPDGTINLSDTARGTKYSVSQADAFQATRGRGIVAGTGAGPAGGAGPASPLAGSGDTTLMPSMARGSTASSGKAAPMGSKEDPLYTAFADPTGSSGGSDSSSQAQQLGSGFLSGIGQSVGLDGSVFKGFGGASNPMDFGVTKLATGLLNWGMGGQGPGHAMSHSAVPTGPGGSQSVRSGEAVTHNYYGDVNSGTTVNQSGVKDGVQDWQHAGNATNRAPAMTAPNAGGAGVTPP